MACFSRAASSDYWDEHWSRLDLAKLFDKGMGRLLELLHKRLVPDRAARILEGGCGPGHVVHRLRKLGYENVVGVDFAEQTIRRTKATCPGLPIEVGDLTSLRWKDGYFDVYLSFGVIEHFEEGPAGILKEMYRVINKEKGIVICTVPWRNPVRSLKARLGFYQHSAEGLGFYQYLYRKHELVHLFGEHGFRLEHFIPYGGLQGTIQELWIPFPRQVSQSSALPFRIARLALAAASFVCGHLAIYVLRPLPG